MISGCYRQALGAGFNEINLPARQAGSSIMPGKVNPVIPEVVNQVAFRVMGHDVTVEIAAQPSQDYSSTQSMDQSSAALVALGRLTHWPAIASTGVNRFIARLAQISAHVGADRDGAALVAASISRCGSCAYRERMSLRPSLFECRYSAGNGRPR